MSLEVESSPSVEQKEIDLKGVDLRRAGKLFGIVGSKSRQDWPSMGDYFDVENDLDLQMEALSPELQLAFFQFMRGKLQPGELMRELDEERKRLSLPRKLMGNEMSTIRQCAPKLVPVTPLSVLFQASGGFAFPLDMLTAVCFPKTSVFSGYCNTSFAS